MENIQEIIGALGPSDQLHWDIMLYVLFFFNVIMLFLLPDGATLHTMLIIIVLVSVFIDKTYAFGHVMNSGRYTPETCHAKIFIGTYIIRAMMFIAPLIIAGSTDKGNVRALGILLGALGVGYILARWYMDQREVETPEITCMATSMVAQNAGMVLILAYATLRRSLPLRVTLDTPSA